MKRSAMLAIGFVVCLGVISLMSSTVYSQGQLRPVADTGMLPIGPNQVLRISGDGVDQDDVIRFRVISYSQTACVPGGICKHAISSQNLSAPIALAPNEGVTLNIQGNLIGTDVTGTRIVVLSNNSKVKVNASLIDTVTNQTTAVLIALLIP